jgi:AcrR family transcriptional regulator
MVVMKHQRAIDEVEKNERRQQILLTAAALFEATRYEQVNMLEVAQRSGIAKGTVYLYFSTKEELFLALLDKAFGDWFAELQRRLAALPDGDLPARTAAFAAALTGSLQQHGLLVRLLPILHTVLEHNIPYAAALEFKQHLRAQLLQTGQQIEGSFAFLRTGQGVELLLSAYAGLIGLQSMAEPAEVVRQVLQLPEMAVLVVDANSALRQMIERLLNGLYIENTR